MKTIASEWAEFSGLVLAPDAPPTQRTEMKRAFYAGALAFAAACSDRPAGEQMLVADAYVLLMTKARELVEEVDAYHQARIRARGDGEGLGP